MTPLPSPQQLRYLLALAASEHFGRAARDCAVTQSTLSAGILALERQLDAAILDRSAGKRVVFTPLGHDLLARAREAMAALQSPQLLLEMRTHLGDVRGERVELIQDVQRGPRREQVATVGRAVVAGEDLRGDVFSDQRGANWHT